MSLTTLASSHELLDGRRLSVLHETGLLDTPPEPAFDRLTAFVTRMLDVPVSLVTLVDGTRQFLKSARGLREPYATLRETPVGMAFCRHTLNGKAVVVDDARRHVLAVDEPAVDELGVVAYAGVPLTTVDGETLGALCAIDHHPRQWSADDISVLRQLAAAATTEIELRRAQRRTAMRCPVTNLPSRALFLELVRTMVADRTTGNDPSDRVTVVAFGLDDFGRVNATYGHRTGDELLRNIAQRLDGAVRGADVLARLDGDVFAVAGAHVHEDGGALRLAQRLQECFDAPFTVGGESLHVSATAGLTVALPRDADAERLIEEAEDAVRCGKSQGRRGVHVSAGVRRDETVHEMRVEHLLRGALDRGELQVAFQPIVDIEDEQAIGAEALLRWSSPVLGNVPPMDFVPIAEQTGLIVRIGEWILERACRYAKARTHELGRRVSVSVNLSARQISEPDLPGVVAGVLERTELPPSQLVLEITESVLLADSVHTDRTLSALVDLGVRLHLDDFGTGYSSLSYLKRVPLSAVKIDRQFVRGFPGDRGDRAICTAIIEMARALEVQVVAEGVETTEQSVALRDAGCHLVQGYLYGRPEIVEAA